MLRIASLALPRGRKGRLPVRYAPVVGLLSLLIVLLTVLGVFHVWSGYREAIERGETRAVTAAQTAAAHVRWLMEANLQVLARIDAALAVSDGQLDVASAETLREIVETLPAETAVQVFDSAGQPVFSTAPPDERINIAGRSYFRALLEGRSWHVSRMLVAPGTGRKVFTVARRVERDGQFMGVVDAVVPIQVMGGFWASLDLGPGSSVGLLREDGWLVARHPEPEDSINLGDYPLFTVHLAAAPNGFYHSEASPADGVARIVGFERIQGLPLIAVVGISREWALARFRASATAIGLIGVPLTLGLVGLTAWVVVLLRRDEAARLRDEEMRARLTEALEHNRMLVREAYHRVKNHLQAVSAMVQLGPGSAETRAEMTRRIAAMAALHEQVYLSDQFETVRLDEYIGSTVERLREAHPDGAEICCELDPVEVPGDRALPLALIVSEVVSNALKHAFADGRAGSIRIALRREAPGRAVLSVADDGSGFVPGKGSRGLGMRLVQAFARQVGGEASFRSDRGTRFALEFPV